MQKIAVIGCGFSGLSFTAQLVENLKQAKHSPIFIDIYDKSANIPRGLAYSTQDPDHLLNVPAYRMSALNNDPNHLVNWLKSKKYNYTSTDFIPRKIYGDYLESVLENLLQTRCAYVKIYKENVDFIAENFNILGRKYDFVILATGNEPKNIPGTISAFDHANIEKICSPKVVICGSNLTMVDTVITLSKNVNIQQITAISRHSFLPKVHKLSLSSLGIRPIITPQDAQNLTLSALIAKFHREIAKLPNWRMGFDSIRPISQEIWQNLPHKSQVKFLRKLMPYYAKFRHRMPPHQAKIIQDLIQKGRLKLMPGDIHKMALNTDIPVINCTGIELNVAKSRNYLLQNLIKCKLLTPHPTKVGIKQSNHPRLLVISPILTGELGEIFAVPELRKLAHDCAEKVLNFTAQHRHQEP